MTLSSAEIKRQILESAKDSSIKKKMEQTLPGIPEGEQIEMGNDLEIVTKMKGWIWIESYMIRRMNLVGLAFAEKDNPDQKGMARGFIELMQWIQLAIQARDEILAKEKTKYAKTENVPENEGK